MDCLHFTVNCICDLYTFWTVITSCVRSEQCLIWLAEGSLHEEQLWWVRVYDTNNIMEFLLVVTVPLP
jgi:hypothetical protein